MGDEPSLVDVNLRIRKGEFVLLAGPSGSGKSTLCKCFNGLIPNFIKGSMSGDVFIDGLNTKQTKVYHLAEHIGMVFQNPEDNIFSLVVEDELAFGPENLGLAKQEIMKRVEQSIRSVGIEELRNSMTYAVSGGQKQKVAIASSLAMLPGILVLDEPTTDLDPVSEEEVATVLKKLTDTLNITIVVVEHELDELISIASRLIVMDQGRIVLDGTPREILGSCYEKLNLLGLRVPQCVEVAHMISERGFKMREFPLKLNETTSMLRGFFEKHPLLMKPVLSQDECKATNPIIINFKDVWFTYDEEKYALQNVNLDIRQGEFVAVIGQNGSGKSTLAKHIVGLLRPTKGKVIIDGNDTTKVDIGIITKIVGYIFQNPENQLFTPSTWEEVAFGLQREGVIEDEIQKRVTQVLNTVKLLNYKDRHPAILSRGEKRRLAVATALATASKVLILDEPTTGQDRTTLYGLLSLLSRLNKEHNTTIVMITHDMEIVPEFADRLIVMKDGQVVLDGPTMKVLSEKIDLLRSMRLKPPAISRLTTQINDIPMVHTMDDFKKIIEYCGVVHE